MKRSVIITICISALVFSCRPLQNIQVSRSTAGSSASNTYIYCLPKTRVDIDIAITKTIIKKGPYAEYASKYLSINNVPLVNSEYFEVTESRIIPVCEPDADQYFAVSYKNYPANLDKLFSVSNLGLMLDFTKLPQDISQQGLSDNTPGLVPFTRNIYTPNIKEHVDTLYKTILTDSSFIKVPVYKKTVQIKNDDDRAKEMAERLLKVQKRKLKISMGDTEYRLDGTALKIVMDEITKQENELLALFIGKKITQTRHYFFSEYPGNTINKDLFWFSPEKGFTDSQKPGATAISFSMSSKDIKPEDPENTKPEKVTNQIFYRAPVMCSVILKSGSQLLLESKIPVYQFGKIRTLPVSN